MSSHRSWESYANLWNNSDSRPQRMQMNLQNVHSIYYDCTARRGLYDPMRTIVHVKSTHDIHNTNYNYSAVYNVCLSTWIVRWSKNFSLHRYAPPLPLYCRPAQRNSHCFKIQNKNSIPTHSQLFNYIFKCVFTRYLSTFLSDDAYFIVTDWKDIWPWWGQLGGTSGATGTVHLLGVKGSSSAETDAWTLLSVRVDNAIGSTLRCSKKPELDVEGRIGSLQLSGWYFSDGTPM